MCANPCESCRTIFSASIAALTRIAHVADSSAGTDSKYRAYKQRLSQAKASERKALEAKLLEQTEAEGVIAADEAEKKWFWQATKQKAE